jgi:hypothetical protein
MSPEQALELLYQASKEALMPLVAHQRCHVAHDTLLQALSPVPVNAKEPPPSKVQNVPHPQIVEPLNE